MLKTQEIIVSILQSLLEIPFTEPTLNKYQQNSAGKKKRI